MSPLAGTVTAIPLAPMATPVLIPVQGEMGARTAAHDWQATSVGPMAQWPVSLATAVGVVLNCELPMYLAWGPGRTQFYNDAYRSILGPRHPAALGASVTETWPEIWPTIGPMWDEVLAGRSIGFEDFRLAIERHGDPEDCYFHFSYSPVADDAGRPAGVLVTFVETTDRVLAERRARFQLELSDALRGLSDPSEITELTCRKLGELLGLRRAGYARIRDGRVHVDLRGWYDDSVSSVLGSSFPLQSVGPQVAEALLRGETVRIDDVQRDPRTHGHTDVYDRLRASGILIVPVMRHGQLIAVVAASAREPRHWQDYEVQITEDAAERTRAAVERAVAELALKRQQDSERERMRALFDQAPIFMASLQGPEHRFDLVNPAYEALLNVRGLVGQRVADVLPEASAQGYVALLDSVYASGRPHLALDAPLQLEPDATERGRRYVDFIYQPILDPSGAVNGIFVVGSDVTERHEAELALKQADRRKDEFLAMLAHELRNPLAPIAAAADLLTLRGGPDAATRRAAEVIGRQVRHMTGLIDDLLDVSRVTRGQVQLDLQRLDVKRVAAEAVEQLRPQIEARGHVLALESGGPQALVLGDSKRLVQVLGNLLSNAAKYTGPGGRIGLTTAVEGNEVVITVRDNGIGMDEAMVRQAFELFVQAHRSADRSQGGLGIGLALVRSLVRMHGGSVVAFSAGPGHGSCFTVRLPRLTDHSPAAALTEAPQGPARRAFDILVVDDNTDAAEMLSLSLQAAGHRVRVADGSFPALVEARRSPPEVCLLDIGLPDLDGYGLASQLRADPLTRAAILIAITGYGQDKDREAALAAGFDHHFAKPVDLAELQRAMDDARHRRAPANTVLGPQRTDP